jgi:hypothetical protein
MFAILRDNDGDLYRISRLSRFIKLGGRLAKQVNFRQSSQFSPFK